MLFNRTARKIIQGLRKRGVKIAPQRFRLTEYDTRPEQVDVARIARRGARGVAFKQVDALRDHAETPEKIRPELLSVGLLSVAFIRGFPFINAWPPVGHHGGEVFPDVAPIQGDYSKRRSHTLNTTVMLARDLSHARTIPTHDVAPLCVPTTPKIPAVARLH
ncbi:hypothetical protein JOF49_002042 [Corynebacterium suicordis]|uniref:Uncharacterized protein n=1 Tax=Corynebacterium suicordis DSM 45110 TaxID=1121369 RepID=A0ABR9ZMX3_9CORY|nr:hypothetical protein [Corynebacterium suicordis DSM 45110]MDR6278648.1 hypothetical protein [Corynebacterium suicordis]